MVAVKEPLGAPPPRASSSGGASSTLQWTTAVPRAAPASRAGAVRESLVGREFDNATDVAVCDGATFVGLVPLERLLAADPETPIRALTEAAVTVTPDTDEERAVHAVARASRRSIAVVD